MISMSLDEAHEIYSENDSRQPETEITMRCEKGVCLPHSPSPTPTVPRRTATKGAGKWDSATPFSGIAFHSSSTWCQPHFFTP